MLVSVSAAAISAAWRSSRLTERVRFALRRFVLPKVTLLSLSGFSDPAQR